MKFEIEEKGNPFEFPILQILGIKEFREDNRVIQGYDCFKVELTYKEKFSDRDWESYRNDLIQRKEMWVTDRIKASLHPVERMPEILEKYYPLEIMEYKDEIQGFKTVYKLERIDID